MKTRNLFALLSLLFCVSSAPAITRADNEKSTPAALKQTDARLARLESLILNHINQARREAGLSAVTSNAKLAEVSRAHSAEMRDKKYFAHESPTEELREPLDRYLQVFERQPRLLAENIFRSWGGRKAISDDDAQRAHNSLMNSPGHRANILRGNVTQIGIGVTANENGDLWVTQMFIKP